MKSWKEIIHCIWSGEGRQEKDYAGNVAIDGEKEIVESSKIHKININKMTQSKKAAKVDTTIADSLTSTKIERYQGACKSKTRSRKVCKVKWSVSKNSKRAVQWKLECLNGQGWHLTTRKSSLEIAPTTLAHCARQTTSKLKLYNHYVHIWCCFLTIQNAQVPRNVHP